MAFDLAKNRINLLDIRKLDYNQYVVMFEYQYMNNDKSKIWQKEITVYRGSIDDLYAELSDFLVEHVKRARAELEK